MNPSSNHPDDELLSAYLDDALSPAERAQVERRLNEDAGARQLPDELRRASQAVADLPRHALKRDLRGVVLAAARRDAVQPATLAFDPAERRRARSWWMWPAAAVAAALLVMALPPERDPPGARMLAEADRRDAPPRAPSDQLAISADPAPTVGGGQGQLDALGVLSDEGELLAGQAKPVVGPAMTAAAPGASGESGRSTTRTTSEPRRMAEAPQAALSTIAVEARDALDDASLPVRVITVRSLPWLVEALARQNIVLIDEDPPADVAAALAEAAGEGATPVTVLVVEALPQQLAALLAAVEAREPSAGGEILAAARASSRALPPGRARKLADRVGPASRRRGDELAATEAPATAAAPADDASSSRRRMLLLVRAADE